MQWLRPRRFESCRCRHIFAFLHQFLLCFFASVVVVMVMIEILVLLSLDAEKHVLEPFSPDFRMMVRQGTDAPEPYPSGKVPYPAVLSSMSTGYFTPWESRSWAGTTMGKRSERTTCTPHNLLASSLLECKFLGEIHDCQTRHR